MLRLKVVRDVEKWPLAYPSHSLIMHVICSIKLKFRDGLSVYCVFINPHKKVRIMSKPYHREGGRD